VVILVHILPFKKNGKMCFAALYFNTNFNKDKTKKRYPWTNRHIAL